MLRIVHAGNSLPGSWPLDPTAEFEPGMIAQLKVLGNDIICGISDGTAPLGIIDDVRTAAFTKTQIDEIIEITVVDTEVDLNGNVVNSHDEVGFLSNSNLIDSSFTSTLPVILNEVHGAVRIRQGTVINYVQGDKGRNYGFLIVANNSYRIPNMPGDDSTVGSGRVTVHYDRGFYATDQFDTTQQYALNVTLYVGLDGKLTSKQPTANHPGVAVVTGPPSSLNGSIELLWL